MIDPEKAQIEIDAYLSGEMSEEERLRFDTRLEESEELKRLFNYNKVLYQQIEVWAEYRLHKRLDQYYEDYLAEQESSTLKVQPREPGDDSARKPRINRKYLILFVGFISIVLLGALYFYGYEKRSESPKPTVAEGQRPGKEDKPVNVESPVSNRNSPLESGESPVEREEKARDSLNRDRAPIAEKEEDDEKGQQNIDPDPLALVITEKLDSRYVQTVQYPSQLSYTFDGETLKLRGDPSIAPLRVKLWKHSRKYFVQLGNMLYALPKTSSFQQLPESSLSAKGGRPTAEEVTVQLLGLQESAVQNADLQVFINQESKRSYSFKDNNGNRELILTGNYASSPQIYVVNGVKYYMLYEGKVYSLNPNKEGFTRLMPLNVQQSAEARLFNKVVEFDRKVYEIE